MGIATWKQGCSKFFFKTLLRQATSLEVLWAINFLGTEKEIGNSMVSQYKECSNYDNSFKFSILPFKSDSLWYFQFHTRFHHDAHFSLQRWWNRMANVGHEGFYPERLRQQINNYMQHVKDKGIYTSRKLLRINTGH
jgi:hypothetical protein